MTSDLDIWRSANLLLKLHGPDAKLHAAMRADDCLDAGDIDGQLIWKRVLAAIDELGRSAPRPNEPVN